MITYIFGGCVESLCYTLLHDEDDEDESAIVKVSRHYGRCSCTSLGLGNRAFFTPYSMKEDDFYAATGISKEITIDQSNTIIGDND